MHKNKKCQYLNKSNLMERGWHTKLIKDLLPDPEVIRRSNGVIKEYRWDTSTVENAESTFMFRRHIQEKADRKLSQQNGAKSETNNFCSSLAAVFDLEIHRYTKNYAFELVEFMPNKTHPAKSIVDQIRSRLPETDRLLRVSHDFYYSIDYDLYSHLSDRIESVKMAVVQRIIKIAAQIKPDYAFDLGVYFMAVACNGINTRMRETGEQRLELLDELIAEYKKQIGAKA